MTGAVQQTDRSASFRPPARVQVHPWNDTARDYPRGLCVHELVEAQARRTPDAPAVSCGGTTLTYRELDARANQVARLLRRHGVGPDVLVGVYMERSIELVAAMLGVLKAGGAYVPLDPAYPPARVRLMLADTRVPVLLTQPRLAGFADAGEAAVVALDGGWGAAANESADPVSSGADPENLSHVIYTSGSTGTPKGVQIRHSSVVTLIQWAPEVLGIGEGISVLASTSVCFDVHVAETWVPLSLGARIVVVPNALHLAALPEGERVEVASMVPSAAAELLRMGGIPSSVRSLNLGGEPLRNELAQDLYRALPHLEQVINLYGPTEDTTYSTWAIPPRGTERPMPVGVPVAESRVYILDAGFQPVPHGGTGEIWIGGAGVSRGYLRRPAATAERYLPDPFSPEPGGRMYRTGDLGRAGDDGQIDCLGRTDHQVKVRGYRVELGEVEEALRRHPAVADAAAAVREDVPGDRVLVGYVMADGAAPTTAELKTWLGERLPEYMVPTFLVVLDALPRLPNGKVDRGALPAPEVDAERAYVAPRTPAEDAVCRIWAEVLGVARVGAEDDFFELGGHSLRATQVVARVRQAFGAELAPFAVFELRTPAELARAVERGAAAHDDVPALVPVPRDQPVPLSFSQRAIWFFQELSPGMKSYNFQAAIRFDGRLDVPALERALTQIVARHEIFRTVFREVDGEARQLVQEPWAVRLPVTDLRSFDEDARQGELERLLRIEFQKPFLLGRLPLVRWSLYRTGDEAHVLAAVEHHFVHDGWSFGRFLHELAALYAAFAEGRPSPLGPLEVQFADYAVWQHAWMRSAEAARQLEYWKRKLAGLPPVLELPADHPRPAEMSFQGRSLRYRLPPELAIEAQEFSRRHGVTLYMTLMAAYQALLHRYTGQADFAVGGGVANRNERAAECVIGMIVNTVPLRADVSGDPTVAELLRRVRETTFEAYAHREVPFGEVVEAVQPERRLSHLPIYQTAFSFHDAPYPPFELPGARMAVTEALSNESAKFDLQVIAIPRGSQQAGAEDEVTMIWEYATDLFEEATVRRMEEHYRTILRAMLAGPEARVSALPLLAPEERARVVEEWNATAARYRVDLPVHRLVEAWADEAPDAPAVAGEGLRLTYGELDRAANRIANALLRRGVRRGDAVAVCMERSPELVAALLGVVKAGAAYVPVDPAYPDERIRFMLQDTAAPVAVAQSALAARIAGFGVPVLAVDPRAALAEPASEARPAAAVGPGDLAYVIYTSGSTGRPKGVMVEHRALANLAGWHREAFELTAVDRATLVAGVGFDASTWETWPYLASGASLQVAPEEARTSPAELRDWLVDQGITVTFLPTPLAESVLPLEWPADAPLRVMLVGGDRLRSRPAASLPFALVNNYGPTENTVVATSGPVGPEGDGLAAIGRPIGNTAAYVLDAYLNPVPAGVPGELYVGGAQVARGYLRRPAMTAEKFVPDPFSAVPGARMYATGDRVRWTAEGEIDFLGRTDFQVKVRGFRIEPGEIEAALRTHPAVADAVCVARADEGGAARLLAWAVGDAGDEALPAALRAHLRERLPEYMVPAAIGVVEAFPLTPNGKVDTAALAAPEAARAEVVVAVPPRNETERVLADAFAEVLRVPQVGVFDNFFELGGDSILAMQVVSRARAAGLAVTTRQVFQHQTVAGLASVAGPVDDGPGGGVPLAAAGLDDVELEELLQALGEEGLALDLSPAQPPASAEAAPPPESPPPLEIGPRTAPASFAQERLWFLHRLEPDSPVYNISAAWRLSGPLDAGTLRRALDGLVRRHESLRTTFGVRDGAPVQVIAPAAEAALEVVDLDRLPAEGREEAARRVTEEEADTPFDLERGPLFRPRLLRLSGDDHVLVLTLHHAVADGWSMGVLYRELAALYAAALRGAEAALPALPEQYADHAARQRERLTAEALGPRLAWWRERLADAPPLLELPADRPRAAAQSYRGAREPVALPPELVRALRGAARAEGATLFMALAGAWQALLARWSGQDQVVVGTPVAGRTETEAEALIGFFANTLALRADLSGDPTFRALLAEVRREAVDAFAHDDVPFERVVEALRPDRTLSYHPVFQVMFSTNAPSAGLRLEGVEARRFTVDRWTSKFDLSVELAEGEDGGVQGWLFYSTQLFDAGTVRRLLRHYLALLRAVAADPGVRVGAVDLADEGERRALPAWPAPAPAPHATWVDAFRAQAARTPGAPALVDEDGALPYRALDERTDRLARVLRGRGVGPEARVGVLAERDADTVAAIMAVLKAGGAYVPLDPAQPPARLAALLRDSGARAVVGPAAALERLEVDGIETVALDGAAVAEAAPGPLEGGAGPENLAYVIYTSGSTGTPRGVMVEHGALWRYLRWVSDGPLEETAWVPALSHPTFDASLKQLLAPLARGGAVWLLPRALAAGPAALLAALRTREGAALNCVPALWATLLDAIEAGEPAPQGLVRVLLGGEALPPALLERTRTLLPRVEVWNLYGPTETTANAAAGPVAPGGPVPLGRPLPGTALHVLDRRGRPQPAGVPGELYVSGAGVARGYLGRPGQTAERFVPDPFSPEPGARTYRTGDRVRRTESGGIEFLGRVDFQVKVRGYRVEPGEVEAVLATHPAVREAVVVAHPAADGEVRLAAYAAVHDGAAADAGALREHLRARLPEYMVPAAVTVLDALPLGPTGKVDRRALPAPAYEACPVEDGPRTPAEEVLAAIWADLLDVPRAGPADGFFSLGGHSLLAARLVWRIRDAFRVELPLRAVFEHPTLADLARAVARVRGEGAAALPPIRPADRGRPLPLSFAQQRLWFLDRLEPGSPLYNVPLALRLSGELDAEALARALGEVARRHEALRTTFHPADGDAVQVVDPAGGLPLGVDDLSDLPPAERDAETERRVREETTAPFELARGPLCRARLLRRAADDHVLVVTLHHAVSDGWSVGVLLRELSALYGAFRRGEPSPLPEPPVQYADFAAWQREHVADEVLAAQLAWWRERLAGAPAVLALPADRPRPPVQRFRGAREPVLLPPELAERLRRLARGEGATLFMTLLAAFQALLSRHAGQTDVVVGTPIAGRTRPETEGLIGLFVNTLALRADLSGTPTFRELLAQVRETTLGAYANQDLPFERLVEELQPERSLGHAPLFQAMLVLQNAGEPRPGLDGLKVERLPLRSTQARFDLTCSLAETERGIEGVLEYATDLFDAATAERMVERFRLLLAAAAADPDAPVADLPLLGEAERETLLGWAASPERYPAETALALLEAQAARTPEAAAVVHGGEALTYAELHARANRLAHHLRGLGIGVEDRVGVCLDRTPELVVALLGVLKAGAAYVPLDPAYPAERIDLVLGDAGARALVTTAAQAERISIPSSIEILRVDADAEAIASRPSGPPRVPVDPENLAHVIYTSGSTGRPKGVMIRHGSVAALLRWMHGRFPLAPGERVLGATSVSFDVSVAEIHSTLFRGAALVLVENALSLAEPGAMAGAVQASMVPGAAAELLRLGALPGSLRRLNLGGEALAPELARALYAAGVQEVHDLYGPTEDTTYSTDVLVPRDAERAALGRSAGGKRAYVLDARLRPAPVGVPGEIWVAGCGLARGYLDRPGMTAERFLPDPLSREPGARMYRTGDRGRWLDGGSLEYLGRLDFQVKVRGFRIEPGEIEAALRRHPRVDGAAVMARGGGADTRLVAYVTPAGADRPVPAELEAHLAQRLPAYMVPGAFVVMDAFPRTPNGKLDRRALPEPEEEEREEYTPPSTPEEERLAAIWAEALGRERVGAHDNFFALGGHSLLAARVVARAAEAFGTEVPLRTLFEHPTVAGMTAALAADTASAGAFDIVGRGTARRLMDDIDGLSEEEMDRILASLAADEES